MAISVGSDGAEKPLSDINTTPLVDVMLVMLIIFLIAVPVVVQNVKVKLPDVGSRQRRQSPKTCRWWCGAVRRVSARFIGTARR